MDEQTPHAAESAPRSTLGTEPQSEGRERAVAELGPRSTGRWLVRSRNSEHIFDLDARTYSRQPGVGHIRYGHDGHTVRLTVVERWPRVGEKFFIWVDDHEYPRALEHWHQSAPIVSITALPAGPST